MGAEEWLKRNKCPHCKRRKQPACPYKKTKSLGGWRCYGYRSRYFDAGLMPWRGETEGRR